MPSPQSICWIEILISKALLNTTISRYSHSFFWETHVDWSELENECYILVLLLSSGTVVIDTLLLMVISINYIITEWLFLGDRRIGRWESLENWSSLALGLESQVYHFPCDLKKNHWFFWASVSFSVVMENSILSQEWLWGLWRGLATDHKIQCGYERLSVMMIITVCRHGRQLIQRNNQLNLQGTAHRIPSTVPWV